MSAWRIAGSGLITLVLAGSAWAQTYPLTETVKADECFRYELQMNLTGTMHIPREEQPAAVLKLSAQAKHAFPERILMIGTAGLPQKSARIYETARAVIQVEGSATERVLADERSLIVVQRPKDQTVLYSPKGHLSREELDLTDEHFDTLVVTGLLPGKAVAANDTWKLNTDVVQALCHLEGVTGQDLTCKLEEVKGNDARVSVKGSVGGISLGALVKLTVDSSYHFDLGQKRLVAVDWKQKDERGLGPVNPASVMDTAYTLKRTPIAPPATLSNVALISVPAGFEVPATLTQLVHHDAKSRFHLLYAREWHVSMQTEERLIMRLMDRGDFVAQVTITPWSKAAPGQHMTADDFRKAMADTPGWEQQEVLQAGEVSSGEPGRWVYRLSALGEMDGMKLLQNFYLVAGPGGEQIVLAFTMTKELAEKLGTRDLLLVNSVELPGKSR